MNWFSRIFQSLRPKRSCWHRRLVDGLAVQCPVCRAESEALATKAKDELASEIAAFTQFLKAALPKGAERAMCEITFDVGDGKFRYGFSFKEPKGYSPPGDELFGPLMNFFNSALKKGHAVTKLEFLAERRPDRAWHVSLDAFTIAFGKH